MAAATVAFTAGLRSSPQATCSEVPITITLSTTAYATANGGVAFDLAAILNSINAQYDAAPNPYDIYAMTGFYYPSGAVTTAFIVTGFALGTPTYTAVSGASTQNSNLGTLATCPCTARMYGTGSANLAALGEIADGNLTGTMTVMLKLARGGHN